MAAIPKCLMGVVVLWYSVLLQNDRGRQVEGHTHLLKYESVVVTYVMAVERMIKSIK